MHTDTEDNKPLITLDMIEAWLEQHPRHCYIDNSYAECGTPRSDCFCPVANALSWMYGGQWVVKDPGAHKRTSAPFPVYTHLFSPEVDLFIKLVDSIHYYPVGMWNGEIRVWHCQRMIIQVKELMRLQEPERRYRFEYYSRLWKNT